jgi:hypothetical protein
MSKQNNQKQQEKIKKVIKLASPVRSQKDCIKSRSMIPQIAVALEGVRAILYEKQSPGKNDLYYE